MRTKHCIAMITWAMALTISSDLCPVHFYALAHDDGARLHIRSLRNGRHSVRGRSGTHITDPDDDNFLYEAEYSEYNATVEYDNNIHQPKGRGKKSAKSKDHHNAEKVYKIDEHEWWNDNNYTNHDENENEAKNKRETQVPSTFPTESQEDKRGWWNNIPSNNIGTNNGHNNGKNNNGDNDDGDKTDAKNQGEYQRDTPAPTLFPTLFEDTTYATLASDVTTDTMISTELWEETTVTSETNKPTAIPTQRPTINPTKRPTRKPTVSPTIEPTLSPSEQPTPLQYCPDTYDPLFQGYVAGDRIEADNQIYECLPDPYEKYCNIAMFNATLLEEDENASDLWNHCWSYVAPCYSTETPTSRPSMSPSSKPTTAFPTSSPTTSPSESPTLSPTPPQYCPDKYDRTKTDYVAGDRVESDGYIFECQGDIYEAYCNQPNFLPWMTKQDSNAKLLWMNAWMFVMECYRTETPTTSPTDSVSPSISPTGVPSISLNPTGTPTHSPSEHPTSSPSLNPTESPSLNPTESPSLNPTESPTLIPSFSPTMTPSLSPTDTITPEPSAAPSHKPTRPPTSPPTTHPSSLPSFSPSSGLYWYPDLSKRKKIKCIFGNDYPDWMEYFEGFLFSNEQECCDARGPCFNYTPPTVSPTRPTPSTVAPSFQPTTYPSSQPTNRPSERPSNRPSGRPTENPTMNPSLSPSASPTERPTTPITDEPTSKQPTSMSPSKYPTSNPVTDEPSNVPSKQPSTANPTNHPSVSPVISTPTISSDQSTRPFTTPSTSSIAGPTNGSSEYPSNRPTTRPTDVPTKRPSPKPSTNPSKPPVQSSTSSGNPTTNISLTKNMPKKRFTEWSILTESDMNIAQNSLGYSKYSWNVFDNDIEKWAYADLYADEAAAVDNLGINRDQWDCWINHYIGYWWSDLELLGITTHLQVLGWNEGMWEGNGNIPETENMYWDELSAAQQAAANEICYSEFTWDRIPLKQWE